MDKQEAKLLISQLLSKALVAIIKMIRVKILPKATERYCKNLQKFADKLVKKANELVDKVPTIKETKKLVGTLYVLRLIKETSVTVGRALIELANHIETSVDFGIIEVPESDEIAETVKELDTLANADTDVDFTGGCGEDGCAIG